MIDNFEQIKRAIEECFAKGVEKVPIKEIDLEDELLPNEFEEIMKSIENLGLLQPLLLTSNKNGRYSVLRGKKRFAAILKLVEMGKWEEDKELPCYLLNLDSVDIPLGYDVKAEAIGIVGNMTYM